MDEERIKVYLEFLACPKCKGDLVYHKAEKTEGFLCRKCSLLYPIVDDIPEMLIEPAIPLKDEPSAKG
jgi:uncharacterized protein YbaR (Trm112 family)